MTLDEYQKLPPEDKEHFAQCLRPCLYWLKTVGCTFLAWLRRRSLESPNPCWAGSVETFLQIAGLRAVCRPDRNESPRLIPKLGADPKPLKIPTRLLKDYPDSCSRTSCDKIRQYLVLIQTYTCIPLERRAAATE
jgi:hypothetical protein